MKRFLFTGFLIAIAAGVFAQNAVRTNIDKANDLLKAGKIADAKTQIDNSLTSEKNHTNAAAWYAKSKIYIAIVENDQLRAQYPDARDQAFDALKKYIALTEKDSILLLLAHDEYKPVNDIYQGYFRDGATAYNAAKYDDALTDFTQALKMFDIMTSKGWVSMKIDTNSNLYAGISAEKANKTDTAAFFYRKLVDAGIVTLPNGSSMVIIFKWLIYYYHTNNDDANADKCLSLAEAKYPDDPEWQTDRLSVPRK